MYENKFELQKEMLEIINILNNNEIHLSDDLPAIVKKYNKKYGKLSLKGIEIGKELSINSTSLDVFEFVDKLFNNIRKHFFNKKLLLIFDGLDDILRLKKEKSEMISGLMRSANYINTSNYKNGTNIKVIILMREDILVYINDPDMNKIKRDVSLPLSWDSAKLLELVELRFKLTSDDENVWKKIFGNKIHNYLSWDYILGFTLSRPRDILQFLVESQKLFPDKNKLSYSEIHDVLKRYSTDYFIEEMKDELTGIIPDEIVQNILPIFSNIGNRNFTYNDFVESVNAVTAKKFSPDFYKETLNVLMQNSLIGQIQLISEYSKETKTTTKNSRVYFKYKNPRLQLNLSNKFLVHQGLYKALNFTLKK